MIKSVSIYLGSKCNMNCAYCHREHGESERGVTEKLLRLLEDKHPEKINFFGGEPTLYMKDIKAVVERCPWAKFMVTTNGKLLHEHIEYFRKHGFKISFSFDGSKKDLRGFNPFEKKLDYPVVCVSTTLYHGNTDFRQILKSFCEAERTAGRWLNFCPHIAHHTSKENEQYALTVEDIENLIAEYKYAVGKFWRDYEKHGVINMRYRAIFVHLLRESRANYSFGETYCVGSDRLKVDADGNTFNCLYIRNTPHNMNKQYIRASFKYCEKCEYYPMCGGACVKSISHSIECKFYYGLYSFFTEFINRVNQDKLRRLERMLGYV